VVIGSSMGCNSAAPAHAHPHKRRENRHGYAQIQAVVGRAGPGVRRVGSLSRDSGPSIHSDEFTQAFTPGSSPGSLLSYNVDLTTNVDAGGTPDEFSAASVCSYHGCNRTA
jgi:hypothetical protein